MADKESLGWRYPGSGYRTLDGLWQGVRALARCGRRPGWLGGKLSEFFAEVLAVKPEDSCTTLSKFTKEPYNLSLLLT